MFARRVRAPIAVIVALFLTTLVATLLVACGDGAPASGETTSGLSQVSAPVDSDEPAGTGIANYVPTSDSSAVADALQQLLVDRATAEVLENGPYSATVIVTLPTGNRSETTFTLSPQATLVPDAASAEPGSPLQAFTLFSELTPDGNIEWTYRYVVPAVEFPDDAFARSVEGGAPVWLAVVNDALLPRTAAAQEPSGVEVVATGLFQEFYKEAWGQLEDATGWTKNSPATEAVGSALNVADAWEKSAEYKKLKTRIAKLRECAEDPTNPLTIKAYKEDAASKQRILNEIALVEAEIKMDTAVRFIAALNSQAAGLTRQKWLGFVVGPLTSWADADIAQHSKSLVDDLEKLITACGGGERWSGTIRYETTWELNQEYRQETPVFAHPELIEKTRQVSSTRHRSVLETRIDGATLRDGRLLDATYTANVREVQLLDISTSPKYFLCEGYWGGPEEKYDTGSETWRFETTTQAAGDGETEVTLELHENRVRVFAMVPGDIEGSVTHEETVDMGSGCGQSAEFPEDDYTEAWLGGPEISDTTIDLGATGLRQREFSGTETRRQGHLTTVVTWQLTRRIE